MVTRWGTARQPAYIFFGERNTVAAMKRRTTAPRREAMGGLAKGLDVIRAFTRESPSLTLSEIAAHARLPAATARRCLLTLTELGYVMQSGRNFLLRPRCSSSALRISNR